MSAPPAQQAPMFPVAPAPVYAPFAEQSYSSYPQTAAERRAALASHTSGRVSLWVGAGSLGATFAAFLIPLLILLVPPAALVATIFGIRALILRARGHSGPLAAPVLGLVFSVLSTALFALGVISAVVLIGNQGFNG